MHVIAKMLRALICFVLMLMFIGGFLLSMDYDDAGPKIVGYLNLFAAIFFGFALLRTFRRAPKEIDAKDLEKELEQAGLLEAQEFHATRAVMVEEFDDEGLYYLLDLGDGRTLCLNGQFYYDYEPMTEKDDGVTRARAFPNTHFILKRHKVEGYAVTLETLGESFEPVRVFDHFKEDDFNNDRVMDDGQIVSSPTFDRIIEDHGRVSSGVRTGRWG
jgi:hypothetical protein